MLFFENIALAFASLKSNKMRTLLTMLGIIIGIGAVICIDTLGNSVTKAVQVTMESSGSSSITLGLQAKSSRTEVNAEGIQFGSRSRSRQKTEDDLFTDQMLSELMTEFEDDISAITISESLGNGTVKKGSNYAYVDATGVNKDFFEHGNTPDILSGAVFDDRAYKEGRAVCLVSDYFCNNLYDGDTEKAIGNEIDVIIGSKYYTFTIMGVYKYEANAMMAAMFNTSEYDTSTSLYIPVNNVKKKTHTNGYSNVTILADTSNGSSMDDIMNEVKSYLDRYYHSNDTYEPSTMSISSIVEEFNKLINIVKKVFAAVAAISLLVGGIGVMNIMLVSISERTKEIGTRKALGASNGSIRTQFIVEAVVLCLVGGAIGIATGIVLGGVAATVVGKVSEMEISAAPSIASIVIAVVFSLAIGVFFGYYPANKAAKMNPIDALRYE